MANPTKVTEPRLLTFNQYLIVALLLILLAIFATDRFRVELVALGGLAAGVMLGLVPLDRIFSGLSNPAVVTVVEVLLIVQALQRGHLVGKAAAWLEEWNPSPRILVVAICAIGAALSTVMNNVGAFSLMLPVAFFLTKRLGMDGRAIFMPLSFATLLGGLCTPIGTPPNLIVSQALTGSIGHGFGFFDFLPTGLLVTVSGLLVLGLRVPQVFPLRLAEKGFYAPRQRQLSEITLGGGIENGITVKRLAELIGGTVKNVLRDGRRIFPLQENVDLRHGDIVAIEADKAAFAKSISLGQLEFARSVNSFGDVERMEAVILPQSVFVGSRAATISAFITGEVKLLAISSQFARFDGPLEEVPFHTGDLLTIEGKPSALESLVDEAGLIEAIGPVTQPNRRSWVTPFTFVLGILLASLGLASPEVAFGGVVLALACFNILDLRAALEDINWSIILLLVAMLPLGEAVGTTGAAAQIAEAVSSYVPAMPSILPAAFMMGLAMLITPFVNNATTAVILTPIAIELAKAENSSPQMMLMAVAMGASCDFLTPFGHHNNTLAYGLGAYRFSDFPRLGWPLSVTVYLVGTLALAWWWMS